MPAVVMLAIAGLALSGAAGPAGAAPTAGAVPPATASSGEDIRVTLITGDSVLVKGGDPARMVFQPGAGREDIGFNVHRTPKHTYVIPADVSKALGDGRLDRRLFDVTGLIAAGYDDASSPVIPVLATYEGTAKRSAPAGAKVTRHFPSIGAAALSVDKKNATAFLGTPSARSASGIGTIWLDGKREISLDQSVPQIGGPAAWAAGYTGKGISVAVLDTGVDTTHPDLATQVAGARNFTGESADDVVGHGTHVASTIAGTGAASDGKFQGVAPDAKLYDGKVCERRGCPESAILAGMEWAANDVKARIVNLSLGGTDTPEVDPLEEAVNRLTADTGTLFVIAAGNDGPGDRTVGSPGSADAALTVGNVDRQDQLNPGSSRGPRVGDGAVKPDVTAPGTDIVAARSKDSSIGEPVGDRYLRLTGTSMATPHTAGAAALLLQQHPSWSPAQLKGALMGSAKVAPEQTSFQQGAGRIDVAAAIEQSVIAEPGSVSFGVASYPHADDEPVTRAVTIRNLGDLAVTLDLTSELKGPDGGSAPASALRLSSSSVTVPAGGTASVQAISNTNHSGADGLYSGRITAVGPGGVAVVVPVGVDKERETYTLSVSTLRPDGTASDFPVAVAGVDDGSFGLWAPGADGTVTLRLPKGEYAVDTFLDFEVAPEQWAGYSMAAPSVALTSDRSVALDARQAKVVDFAMPDPKVANADLKVGYARQVPGGFYDTSVAWDPGSLYTLGLDPQASAPDLVGYVTSLWGVPGTNGRFTDTPHVYATANFVTGTTYTGFQRSVKVADLATLDSTVNRTTDQGILRTIWPSVPGVPPGFARDISFSSTPRTTRYYVDQAPVGWLGGVRELSPSRPDPAGRWGFEGAAPQSYRAGRTYRERWNAAAFGPSLWMGNRSADRLWLLLSGHDDADGHAGRARPDSGRTTLTRDGTVIADSDSFGYVNATGLPAGTASFKLVATAAQSVTSFATRVDLTATFTSSANQPDIPIHAVRYQPAVDPDNIAKRTPVTVLPGTVDATVEKLTIQYSGDGGATWHNASVLKHGSTFKAVFPTPTGQGVSLRSTATDQAGNTTTASVVNAYILS